MECQRSGLSLYFLIYFSTWIIVLLEDSVTGVCDDEDNLLDSVCFEVMARPGDKMTYQQANDICQKPVTSDSGVQYRGQGLAMLSTRELDDKGLAVLVKARQRDVISDNDYLWIGAYEDTGQPFWVWTKDDKVLTHQGCYFYEGKPSSLPDGITVDDILPEKCIQLCKTSTYVAVKNPSSCYCINSLTSFRADRRSRCTECAGSPEFAEHKTCGAYSTSHYDIFKINGTQSEWASSQPDNHDVDAYCASLAIDSLYNNKLLDSPCIEKNYVSICDIPLPSDECRGGSFHYSAELDSCIYVSMDGQGLNWYKARENCISRGGDLVTIDSDKKKSFIVQSVGSSQPRHAWVGLTATHWNWNSGTPFVYTNWEDNLIYSKGTNCLAVKWAVHLSKYWWTVQPCDELHFFLCHYDSATSTLGPTTTEVPTTAMTTEATTAETTIPTTEPMTTIETTVMESTISNASGTTDDSDRSNGNYTSTASAFTDVTTQASHSPTSSQTSPYSVSMTADGSEASTSASLSGNNGKSGNAISGGSTDDEGGLSTLEIVLIIMLVVILVSLFVVLLVFLLLKKKEKTTQVGPESYDARGKAIYPNSDPIFVPPGGSTLTYESSGDYRLPPRKNGNLDPKEKIYIT